MNNGLFFVDQGIVLSQFYNKDTLNVISSVTEIANYAIYNNFK